MSRRQRYDAYHDVKVIDVDILFMQIDKIDPTYFRTSRRLDVTEDTKVTADKEQSDRYYNSGEPKCKAMRYTG